MRALERCGAVASANLVTSQATGSRLGFAFVEMDDEGEALGAIRALDGAVLEGRSIAVEGTFRTMPIAPQHGR